MQQGSKEGHTVGLFGRFDHHFAHQPVHEKFFNSTRQNVENTTGIVLVNEIEVGLDTSRKRIAKRLWNPLGSQPVIIALTAEVLHLEKVSFPRPIVFAKVNTRIQLL